MTRFGISFAALLLITAGCASGGHDRETKPAANASMTSSSPSSKRYRNTTDAGDYAVGVVAEASIHDAKRNKDLDIAIEYPTKGGPYPVIIFSHGFGGSKNGYTSLTEYWASRGYVCIKPTHADAGKLQEILRDEFRERREASGGDARRARRSNNGSSLPAGDVRERVTEAIWESQTPTEYVNRAQDISLIIDSLGDLQERFPELKGRIDPTRIGVGGHSYGAWTAMMLEGTKVYDPNGALVVAADPRVKAVIAMSPQGTGTERGLRADSWSDVRIPTMFMTGSLDRGGSERETPEWRREPFQHIPPGDKYLVFIEGASHMSFNGGMLEPTGGVRPGGDEGPNRGAGGFGRSLGSSANNSARRVDPEMQKKIFSTIKLTSLAFWDAYLRGDAAGKTYLAGEVGKGVTVSTK